MREDTICALATPSGRGALSVIRISGPEAVKKVRLFVRLPKILETHRAYVRIFREENISLDQVVLTYFEKGRSFTGEEIFEISCHGGFLISRCILQALLKKGLRMAEPGEFSLRAFYNGKKDLVQAEGLFQLIESQSERARKSAFFQMEGKLSLKLEELEKKWLDLLSNLEADIDFSLEGLNLLNPKGLKKNLKDLVQEVQELIDRYRTFETLQKGLSVGLFGPVNSGKSTLFNRLLEEEKAIVTEEEGTTRDIVEGQIQRETLYLYLRDTAGLRQTSSQAEKLGQKKTRKLFFDCEVPVVVLEAPKVFFSKGKDPLEIFFLSLEEKELKERKSLQKGKGFKKIQIIKEDSKKNFQKKFISKGKSQKARELFLKKGLLVVTKKDLCRKFKKKDILARLNLSPALLKVFYFSNREESPEEEYSRFKETLFSLSSSQKKEDKEEIFFIASLRQLQGLRKMKIALKESLDLQKGLGERDLMALALRRGLLSLYEITGKQLDDKILDTLFKKFCIGK